MTIREKQALIGKLKSIRTAALKLQPYRQPLSYNKDPGTLEEITKIDIEDEFDRLKAVLRRFGLDSEIAIVDDILKSNRDDFLFEIQDPPPWAGEYVVLRLLINLVDNLIFAYADDSEVIGSEPANYYMLLSILRGIERSFTITQDYPTCEDDFQKLVDSILISIFPKLILKPTISQQIKNFIPDTGIPETRTLIEYKYIKDKKKVPTTVDQLFADAIGYTDDKWNNLICVIYETDRFCTEDAWKEEMKKIPRVDVVLVRGT